MSFSIPFTIEESTKEEEENKHVDYQSEAQRAKKTFKVRYVDSMLEDYA